MLVKTQKISNVIRNKVMYNLHYKSSIEYVIIIIINKMCKILRDTTAKCFY